MRAPGPLKALPHSLLTTQIQSPIPDDAEIKKLRLKGLKNWPKVRAKVKPRSDRTYSILFLSNIDMLLLCLLC